ncbi:hypothetical protein OJAV_G00119240 [Oryzias javanicus]|uniref:RUN domain-containing protein n=1 Tax=Oryzias javanicus TaxID=123683 RepID=A0A3S2P3B7_ORYJA|nr:hypothetical protein OJAV_G00119240 [Oryzias javanicus]
MIGASSLPGHTMIVCHFPVGKLPPWQLPIPAVRNSARRPGRVCSAGLTRAASLPEQDTINREHAFRGGKRNFSSSYGSLTEDRAEEEGTSDSSGRCDSTSSPEEASSHLKKGSSDAGGHLRSHNSFLPSTEHEEDDEDGDNLHRYYEDSSFALHGNSNWLLCNGAMNYTLSHGDLEGDWNNEGTMLGTGGDQHWLSNHPKQMDPALAECQCFHMRRSDISVTSQDNMCNGIQDKCSPERLSNCQTDSSCTSSDGILVNFCAMYNRSNNPATPRDLSSPAGQTSDDSVLLSLQDVSHSPTEQAQHKHTRVCSPPTDEVYKSRWSPQGVDSNCNLYPQEPEPPGLSSLEVSDLAACLQSQASIAVETNQKYYKLVTCDLSSQSPSPAWSSLTGCAEGQGHISPFPTPPENFRDHNIEDRKESEDHQKEERLSPAGFRLKLDCSDLQACDYQVASTSTGRSVCRRSSSDGLQNHSHTHYSQCLSRCNLHGGKCKAPEEETTRPSVKHHQMNADGTEKGKCSVKDDTQNYKKPQRPTSLPIQPFVLLPEGKPQSEVHLGCLLEQYINQKAGNLQPQQFEELNAGSDQIKQRGSLSERTPSELCFSSDSTYDSMSISHLQRRGLLLSVSSAVDLIMAHFSSSRDPDEKMRLGNSSYSPTISALVLEHLCPAIQNLLNDGLRDHKLDIIIGQRRNHSWNVVEVSTRIGPSTRVLHSLVSKIKQCSQLTSHCMRLRAFIMGLLNLRALEFWLSHLQSQKDLLASYYHSWGFLSMTLGRCQPMFQELLLLLQPLSVLPFDLNLLVEPRLFQHRLLCSETRSPPQPCSALLVTSWPKLQTNRTFDGSRSQQTIIPQQRSQTVFSCQSLRGTSKSLVLDPIPEFWPKESDLEDGVAKTQNIRENHWFQNNIECSKEEKIEEKESQNALSPDKKEDPGQGGRRWSKLFGAANTFGRAQSRSFHRPGRPSQWLQLDAAQLGLLARTIKNLKGGTPTRMEH